MKMIRACAAAVIGAMVAVPAFAGDPDHQVAIDAAKLPLKIADVMARMPADPTAEQIWSYCGMMRLGRLPIFGDEQSAECVLQYFPKDLVALEQVVTALSLERAALIAAMRHTKADQKVKPPPK